MPGTLSLDEVRRAIGGLAGGNRPGAIVLAEHTVDLHVAPFGVPADRLAALDALAGDLVRLGRARPDAVPFLRLVDEYVALLRRPLVVEGLRAA